MKVLIKKRNGKEGEERQEKSRKGTNVEQMQSTWLLGRLHTRAMVWRRPGGLEEEKPGG